MSADGNWAIRAQTPKGEQEWLLKFVTSGASLSGSLEMTTRTVEFSNGKVDGDNLSWTVKLGQSLVPKCQCRATVDGDQIEGEIRAGVLGTRPFSGVRRPSGAA